MSTVDGCILVYSDITKNGFKDLKILPLLKGRADIATGLETVSFDSSDESKDIVVGLYSKFLVRYRKPVKKALLEQEDWKVVDILKFDCPIIAIERGDIYGIGKEFLVVLTVNSVHVIAPKP